MNCHMEFFCVRPILLGFSVFLLCSVVNTSRINILEFWLKYTRPEDASHGGICFLLFSQVRRKEEVGR